MERYIDADALEKDLISRGFYPAIVKRAIEDAPTAGVVSRVEFEAMRSAANSQKMHYDRLEAYCRWLEAKVKADTVRKMQERLKACTYTECSITGHRYGVVQVDEIDRIAEDMLEEEK